MKNVCTPHAGDQVTFEKECDGIPAGGKYEFWTRLSDRILLRESSSVNYGISIMADRFEQILESGGIRIHFEKKSECEEV